MNKVASQAEHDTTPTSNLSPASGFLQRKCACGNHTNGGGQCGQCSKQRAGGLQPKLEISQPGDPYEQEADRIAGQIMRMSTAPQLPEHSAPRAPSSVQRKSNGSPARAGTAVVDDVLSSGGQPLDSATRAFFEPRFGYDFSNVRVHTDDRAAESAKAVNARAYTVGEHVVFGARQFSPGTSQGRQLMAHELTHVVQQGRADATFALDDDSEEDTTVELTEAPSAGIGRPQISRQITPKLTPGLMLQRADCPCCVQSISINNISRIDTAARMGHTFDVDIDLQYGDSGPAGSCVAEWWERTNVPPPYAGYPTNAWVNGMALSPGAVTWAPWRDRTETCASSSPVKITDVPSLGRTPGRTVTRTLEFRIVVNSGPPSSDSGCENASKEVTATQVLTMVSGAPDWAASSFTTP